MKLFRNIAVTLAAMFLLLPAAGVLPALADAPPQVEIWPNRVQVFTGGVGTTQIRLNGADGVQAVEIELKFDPALIQVEDADPDAEGVQVTVNPQLAGDGVKVTRNTADNTTGRVELQLTGLPPDIAGQHLASIIWLGVQPGVAELSLPLARLTGADGVPLDAATQPGIIEVTDAGKMAITGQIILQGRRQHDGAAIYLTDNPCAETGFEPADKPDAVTGSEGFFEIKMDEKQEPGCLRVFQHGYLLGQAKNPTGKLGVLTLPGGDVNGDNQINIFDLAYVGSFYGDTGSDADVNGDNIVSIFDLVLAASNFGQRGPVSNWK